MGNFKKLLLAALIAVPAIGTMAQRTCSTMDVLARQLAADPKRAALINEIEAHTAAFAVNEANNPNARTTVAVTIPVVFHVVYNNATENISDARLNEQLAVLNADFRKLNADRTSVPAVWQGIASDFEINFCLATVDPSGAATTGITRTSTATTSFSDNDAVKFNSSGGKDVWDRSKYLNLWICDLGTQLLGYAQFPGGPASTDGVVLHYAYTGVTGASAPFNKGRTATHEVGHWLNLFHIWGDDDGLCTGSDAVTDTPNQADATGGCPGAGTVRTDACSPSSPGYMWMNYMDYTDDACMYMFTAGQKTRAQALFATGGSRVSLLTSNGCGGSVQYCASAGSSTADEWIQSVAFGPINNTSGNNSGYGNYTGTTYNVTRGTAYNFTLTPGFTASTYPEYWKIWIDYNGDKDFADAGEAVYDAGATSTTARTGSVTISSTATLGSTRMRVSMKYNAAQTACETFSYGEVEDYTLNIQSSASCGNPSGHAVSGITSSGATVSWTAVSGATSYNIQYKVSGAPSWTTTTSTTASKALTGLTASTIYNWQVQAVCSGANSSYVAGSNFTTSAATCTDSYETNETLAAAKVITVNTNISAKICTTTDKDWFRFTTTTALPKVKVTVTTLPADYDVVLYNSAGTQIGIGQAGGTTSETVIYNTATVGATYYVQVYGYNGANSSTAYTLRASTQAANWRVDPNAATSAEGKELANIQVFPNPTSGKATVRFESAIEGDVNVQVMDVMGKVVISEAKTIEAGENNIGFDMAVFPAGIYMVRLEMNGTVLTRRVEVTH